ncbi:hypothetical protein BV898_16377 [Hypsibius exemplaris]|uniref:C2H2-type domain-containing protein n=1 Tax=Hypsibius exemplaris TaxID=2072580 RepID=A0A9X6NDB2_HYPEX|nr:hypothetical protein BV898_16377 [Hypsibius exemplaris]
MNLPSECTPRPDVPTMPQVHLRLQDEAYVLKNEGAHEVSRDGISSVAMPLLSVSGLALVQLVPSTCSDACCSRRAFLLSAFTVREDFSDPNVKKHVAGVHTEVRLPCSHRHCGRHYKAQKDLKIHVKTAHRGKNFNPPT